MFCRPKNAHPMRIFYRPAGFATNAHLKIRIGCAFLAFFTDPPVCKKCASENAHPMRIFYRPAGLQKLRIRFASDAHKIRRRIKRCAFLPVESLTHRMRISDAEKCGKMRIGCASWLLGKRGKGGKEGRGKREGRAVDVKVGGVIACTSRRVPTLQ